MSTEGVEPGDLVGFFEGWPAPPSPERHLALLSWPGWDGATG